MEVALALLADAANTTRDGKLNVLGVFDVIYASKFPSAHPSMVLVLRLESAAADGNRQHELDVRSSTKTAPSCSRSTPASSCPPPPSPAARVASRHPIQINGLQFKKPGNFAFEVRLNGDLATSLPLTVLERKSPPTATP